MLIAELRPVVTAGAYDPQGVTISTAFVFAILFYWGPWPALLVHGIGVVLGEIAKRKPVWKIVFNTGQYVGCLALSALILWLAGLRPTPTHPSGDIDAHTLLVMAVSWAAYFLLNLAMVATAISLRTGTRWWDDFVDDIGYYAITTFAVLALSPVVVVVTKASWRLIPLLLLPLFLVYKTASISLEKEHAAHARPAHRAAQPQAADRAMAWRALRTAERTGGARRAVPARPRPVQGDQRHPRPPRRRPAAADRRQPAGPARCGPSDIVARLGGDEFAVLLPDVATPARRARGSPSGSARRSASRSTSTACRSSSRPASASRCTPSTATTPSAAARADVAMYLAKEERTGVEVYAPSATSTRPTGSACSARCAARSRRRARAALPAEGPVPTARPVGVEALVRWRTPSAAWSARTSSSRLAEQSGLMRQLTEFVLDQALAQAAAVVARRACAVPVAVNVSVRDLSRRAVRRRRGRPAARARRCRPGPLKLEITEHVLMADPGRPTARAGRARRASAST